MSKHTINIFARVICIPKGKRKLHNIKIPVEKIECKPDDTMDKFINASFSEKAIELVNKEKTEGRIKDVKEAVLYYRKEEVNEGFVTYVPYNDVRIQII